MSTEPQLQGEHSLPPAATQPAARLDEPSSAEGTGEATQASNFLSLLKNLAEASILIGAGLFLIGWSYLYGYYRAFGLSADGFNFSVETILVHSIPVATRVGFYVPLVCIASVLMIISLSRTAARVISNPAFALLLLLLSSAIGSRYATGIGMGNAQRDEYLATTTLPYVTLEGTDDTEAGGCKMDDPTYRLLLRANGQVVVVLPIDNVENRDLVAPNIRVCSFPESRVQALRIQVGLPGR